MPAGSYTATAADADRNCATSSPASAAVIVTSGGTLTQNFCLTGSSNLQSNGVTIDDLIIAPDTSVSFVIVGAGGFVGVGKHDVAIPVNQLKQQDGKFVLPGASKEAIKALPKFEYAKK